MTDDVRWVGTSKGTRSQWAHGSCKDRVFSVRLLSTTRLWLWGPVITISLTTSPTVTVKPSLKSLSSASRDRGLGPQVSVSRLPEEYQNFEK